MIETKTLKLEIDLRNDAFQPEACIEIARILRNIAIILEREGEEMLSYGQSLFDINGNDVGYWVVL